MIKGAPYRLYSQSVNQSVLVNGVRVGCVSSCSFYSCRTFIHDRRMPVNCCGVYFYWWECFDLVSCLLSGDGGPVMDFRVSRC